MIPASCLNTLRRRMFLASVAGIVTLGLTACGNKVLDYRNAQINNGKVYAGDANEPFSGKVTNVPAETVLGSQQGFGKLMNAVNNALPTTTLSDMGMGSLCDANVTGGVLDGKTVCKTAQSDTVRIEASFSGGVLDGSFVVHDQTGGNTFVDLSFKDGEPDGTMKIHSPKTGKLIHTVQWSDGVLNGEEEGYDDTTGNRVLHATLVNGRYDGEFTRYAPDGKQVTYRATFSNGKPEGTEETFDPQTGKLMGHAAYVDGKLQGTVKRWNADGTLIYEKDYQEGREVSDSDAIKACAQDHLRSLDNLNGIGIDRMNEFEASCKEALRSSPDASEQPTTGSNVQAAASGNAESSNAPSTRESKGSTDAEITSAIRTAAKDGAPSEEKPASVDACVDQWTAAYRRENGNDAMVSADQIGEWQSWCKKGKQPS